MFEFRSSPFCERTVGSIGDEDEEPLSLMWGTDVGSSKTCPLDMHPVFGQVAENSIEPQSPVSGHILQEREPWS
jgi:hypothetical protein